LTVHAVHLGTAGLYERYGPALLRKAQRILQNPDDAHDVVQALFVEVLQREPDEPIDLAYLYRAVTNRCLNLLRDRATRARLLQQHDPALRGPIRISCDERAIGLDLLAALGDRLGDELGELLVYRYFDEMTQEEIAELTQLSRKTIGKRLEQIRVAVRELLDGDGEKP
jgi:RNA polymerase sigma-70 factor (ECF subfamily)